MADDNTTTPQQVPTPPLAAAVDAQASVQKSLAASAAEAERLQLDETDEGGHYIVNGVHVNAYGKPIKQGKAGKWELVNPDDRKEVGQ